MLTRIFTILLFCATFAHAQDSINPNSVAVLYNSNNPESSKLAFYYAKQRNIPSSNLIGLATSNKGNISRKEYDSSIRDPLRRHFTSNRWWKLTKTQDGYTIPTFSKMRLFVCMRGIPIGITQSTPPAGFDVSKANVVEKSNSASVDSELAVFGVHGLQLQGPIKNPYFNRDATFSKLTAMYPFMLVGRIDGPSFETSKRLIDDAIATEKQGLWGMCYLDKAHKGSSYEIADKWLDNIERLNWSNGIPTTLEDTRHTYLSHYPMKDAALYYGWYTPHKNGPLLNSNFRFKRGAIAIHLHSNSAKNLRHPTNNWVGPLLEKGAAATVGNVFEPYLQLTHDFNILNERLQQGYCFAEATAMASPYLSWQTLAVGDPLYRPFLHDARSGKIVDEDKIYRAISLAFKAWKGDDEKISQRLTTASIQKKDATFYEVLALWRLYKLDYKGAMSYLFPAQNLYQSSEDKIRTSLHLAQLYRSQKNKKKAIETLKLILLEHAKSPAIKSAQSMLTILQPPAPKPAQPRKTKK